MKVDKFVKYARTDACVQTGALKKALFIIDRQRDALSRIVEWPYDIMGDCVFDARKDAKEALEMEV